MDTGIELPEMNLLQAILQRRTCSSFSQEAVEFEKIAQVVQAGMHAPNSGNRQNWQFTVITDRQKLQGLYKSCLEQEVILNAPIGIIVSFNEDLAKKFYGLRGSKLYSVQDCACALMNMSLACEAFGFGSCWIGSFDEEKVASSFGFPPHIRPQAILLLGYKDPLFEPEEKRLKSIEEVLFFNKFGARVEKPHLVVRDYSKEWDDQIKNLQHKTAKSSTSLKETTKEKAQESVVKSKEFFSQAQDRLSQALDNLKDEEKQKKRR